MEAAIFKHEAEGQYSRQSYQRSQSQLQWFTEELARMNLVWYNTYCAAKIKKKLKFINFLLFRQKSLHRNIQKKL